MLFLLMKWMNMILKGVSSMSKEEILLAVLKGIPLGLLMALPSIFVLLKNE